ncbi:MAG: hypothetical protein ABIG68_14205 [Acidobacteriota bacterium]
MKIAIGAALLVLSLALVGCGLNLDSLTGDSATIDVKTMEEYRQDAVESITAESAEAELDQIEREIDGDIADDG